MVNVLIVFDSVFIYNNFVFVLDYIQLRIWIEVVIWYICIYNNIVYVFNGLGQIFIKNDLSYNDFDYNIWFGNINILDDEGDIY